MVRHVIKSLRHDPAFKLRAFILIVALAVLGVATWRATIARRHAIEDSQRMTASLARSLTSHAASTLQLADILVAAIVERVEEDGTGPAALARLHRFLAAKTTEIPQLATLVVFDAAGEVLTSSLTRRTPGSPDRDYFVHHRANPGRATFIGPPVLSRGSGRWSLTASRRVDSPAGAFAGVALATIDFETFAALYRSFDVGPNGAISLANEDGTRLVRVPERADRVASSFAATSWYHDYLRQRPAGGSHGVSQVDGKLRWNSFRKVEGWPLMVSVAQAEDDILAAWRSETATDLGVTAALATLLGLVGWRLADQIRRVQHAEAEARQNEAQYRLLADHTTDLVVHLGPDLRRLYVSPASRHLLGYEPEELLGHHPQGIVHPEDWEAIAAALAPPNGDPPPSPAPPFTCRLRRKDESLVWVEGVSRRMPDGSGTVVALRDITRRKDAEQALHQANNQLQRMVMLDGMTGIANRRCFDLTLAKETRRAARTELPLALLLLDVDHFKSYNDACGHPAGDACLRQIATALTNQIRRPADLAARYGGEEFALLLPETDEPGAHAIADRVRDAVNGLALPHSGGIGGIVTISIGIAIAWPQPDEQTGPQLIENADKALYAAKAAGRDRSCLAPLPMPALTPRG